MNSDSQICPNCGESFVPNHGNRIYCDNECYEEHKSKKQKENNSIIKNIKNGFLDNYSLFVELLSAPGTKKISLLSLMKRGFDQDAYYGAVLDKEKNEWHRVNEYAFRILKDNGQPILCLYKP